jgi:YHS domain-containing protein
MTRTLSSGARLRGWTKAIALAVFAALIGHGAVAAAEERINTGYFGNVAIQGYDPVAYFTMDKAVQGSEELAYDWLGTSWHFANAEHRQRFAAEPIKYAPQYGGYCAIGVAFGELVANIDPEAWFIADGKLYLQYSKAVDADFRADRTALLSDAEANWDEVKVKDRN